MADIIHITNEADLSEYSSITGTATRNTTDPLFGVGDLQISSSAVNLANRTISGTNTSLWFGFFLRVPAITTLPRFGAIRLCSFIFTPAASLDLYLYRDLTGDGAPNKMFFGATEIASTITEGKHWIQIRIVCDSLTSGYELYVDGVLRNSTFTLDWTARDTISTVALGSRVIGGATAVFNYDELIVSDTAYPEEPVPPVETLTLAYASDRETTGEVPVEVSSPYEIDSTVTVLMNSGTLQRNGYTFGGWPTDPYSTGTVIAPESTFVITADTILYPVWVLIAGYVFQEGDTIDVNGDITLYADWIVIPFSVTYNANGSTGGTVPVDPTDYYETDEATIAANSGNLVRIGYTFGGWRLYAASGTVYSNPDTISMAGNVTLYAYWKNNNPIIAKIYTATGWKNILLMDS